MADSLRKSKSKRKRGKKNYTSQKKVKISEDSVNDSSKELSTSNQNKEISNHESSLKDLLLEKTEEELKCNICTEYFIKPVALNCSHTFCEYCISQWERQQLKCPICRKIIRSQCRVLALELFLEKCLDVLSPEMIKTRKSIIASREKKTRKLSSKQNLRRSARLMSRSRSFMNVPIDNLALSFPRSRRLQVDVPVDNVLHMNNVNYFEFEEHDWENVINEVLNQFL